MSTQIVLISAACLLASPLTSISAPPALENTSPSAVAQDNQHTALSSALAELVREAIPRSYERDEDWGRTKHITTGLRVDKLEFSRRKREVKHGVWKRYRIQLADSQRPLQVRVENLQGVGPGKASLTLVLDGKFKGWAQARVYNLGLHLITLTTEGDTELRVRANFEVTVSAAPAAFFAGIQLSPVATDVKVEMRDFELTRFGELHDDLARELGHGLKRLLQHELEGPKLTAKINRAIDKKRDRLRVTPDALVLHPE